MIIHYFLIIIYYKINIVHPQSRDDFISATLAAKLLGKKVVWTDHADLKYVWQNHKTWYKNPVGKLVYVCSKLADNITLVSNSEKRLIEKNLGKSLPSKYKIIYNGVEDNEILPIEIDKLDEDSVIFSATSRMVTAKGIGELIEAFILLDKKYSVGLWLLGEGPEISKFKKMSESCKNIKFLGFPENALSYVAASDIFVHPSYHEGFSISLLEAAKLGMPTIACDVGGNSEIIDNGISGTLVKEKNNTELLAAMELLVNNHSLRKKYGDNLRKRYLKDFVFEDIVKRDFVRLYEK
jgi:glycosyltransferase involved in cell wall biosynthesis